MNHLIKLPENISNEYNDLINEWLTFIKHEPNKDANYIANMVSCYDILRNKKKISYLKLRKYVYAIIAYIKYSPLYKYIYCHNTYSQSDILQVWENKLSIINNILHNNIKETYISYSLIKTTRDSLKKGSIERLLLCMYTYIYPLKYNFHSVKILSYPTTTIPSNDYISLSKDNSILHINSFHTSIINGSLTHKLPKILIDEIIQSLNKRPRDYLFTDNNNNPFTEQTFKEWADYVLTKLFNTRMTIYKLRFAIKLRIKFNTNLIELFKIFGGIGRSLYIDKKSLYIDDGNFLDEYGKHYKLLLMLDDTDDNVFPNL
jgi:hypothetical protein